ncbi:MAG TPA: sialate O-acetylesterase, partial [Ignavibacteriaceae bacterium]|nr:sialate O-acetylesterase [Ignavibacteriaceae bacterium]
MKIKLEPVIILCIGLFLLNTKSFSQDQNFYIFLCFGQSNMEGQGAIQSQDRTVDSRFQVMEAVDCSNLGRIKGHWYTAVPPLCRCYTGLSPAEYFGRTLVANLPDSIRVGIINVSVAGCAIELYDKNNYQDYAATAPDWMISIINEYGGNPYGRLVEIAKLAQQDGVIKGILLHQGESNTGDNQWPSKVKGIYDTLLNDLGLSPGSVPLLAGEVVGADQGGVCASMNPIIDQLPQTIHNSYIISSKGCTDTTDNLHFNSAGYRKLGMRYGMRMLSLLGYDPNSYLESECSLIGGDWEIKADTLASNGKYITIKSGLNSTSAAPSDTTGSIYLPFTVYGDSTFYIYARLNCPNNSHDSYWIKMDNGEYVKFQASRTNGWQWLKLNSYNLSQGDHIFNVAYCEDGAKLDKICISSYDYIPSGKGGA